MHVSNLDNKMNNIFQKILLLIMGIYSCLNAFEVNTHQALTRCAITNGCSNGRTQNSLVPTLLSGNVYQTMNIKQRRKKNETI